MCRAFVRSAETNYEMQLRLRGVRTHARARKEVLRKLAGYGAFSAKGRSTTDSVAYDGPDADAILVVDVLFQGETGAVKAAATFEDDYDDEKVVVLVGRPVVRCSNRGRGDRISALDYEQDKLSPPGTARDVSEASTPASAFSFTDRSSLCFKFQRFEAERLFTSFLMHLVSRKVCDAAIKAADDTDDGRRRLIVFHFLNDASRCPANFLCGFADVHELFDGLGSQPHPRLLAFASEDAAQLEEARAGSVVETLMEEALVALIQAALPAACKHAARWHGQASDAWKQLKALRGLPAEVDTDEGSGAASGTLITVERIEQCENAAQVLHDGKVLHGVEVVVVVQQSWLEPVRPYLLQRCRQIGTQYLTVTLYTEHPAIFRLCLRYKALESFGLIENLAAWPPLVVP